MNHDQLKKIQSLVKKYDKNSTEIRHDYTHVNQVRANALKIVELLKLEDKLDSNLLQAVCLLHDLSYLKPLKIPLSDLIHYIFEGRLTNRMIKKLSDQLQIEPAEQKIILQAIEQHYWSFPWKRLNAGQSLYSLVLQDADTLAMFDQRRVESFKSDNFWLKPLTPLSNWVAKIGRKHIHQFLNFPELAAYFSQKKTFTYQEWGSKKAPSNKTLLCLHGYRNKPEMFEPLAKKLPSEYRIIALQLPMWQRNQFFLSEELARFVHNFSQKIDLKEHILVGFSLGGWVAIDYAQQWPKNTKQLILLNSLPRIIRLNLTRQLYERLKFLLLSNFSLFICSRLTTSNLVRKLANLPKIKSDQTKIIKKQAFSIFGTLIINLNLDLTESFKQLAMKKGIILTKNDQLIKWRQAKPYLKKLVETQISIFNHGDHTSRTGYWEQVAKLVDSDLE